MEEQSLQVIVSYSLVAIGALLVAAIIGWLYWRSVRGLTKRSVLAYVLSAALTVTLILPAIAVLLLQNRQYAGHIEIIEATATPVLTPSRTPTVTLTPSPIPYVVVRVEQSDIYAGPGRYYDTLGMVRWDDRLPLWGRSEDGAWLQLDYLGRKGWIPVQTVRASIEPMALPLAIAPPTPIRTPTRMPSVLECSPTGGAVEPSLCVASVSVQIDEGTPRPVAREERITLKAGDALRLVNLRYCTSSEALADAVAGEAYFFEESVLSYDNALFTRYGARIRADCGEVGDFDGSWVVESGQHWVVIALVHYFSDTFEADDRFYINLDVQP